MALVAAEESKHGDFLRLPLPEVRKQQQSLVVPCCTMCSTTQFIHVDLLVLPTETCILLNDTTT